MVLYRTLGSAFFGLEVPLFVTRNSIRLRRSVGVLALALLWNVCAIDGLSRVRAQAVPDAQTVEARKLFDEGLAFVERQEWQEAADRFGRVLAIRSSAIVSYNYASALVHLDRMVEASRALRGVVADPGASPEVVEAARTLLSGVEPRIGQLTVRLRGDTTDVLVTIDDEPLPEGSIGVPVPVDPGGHVVRATRGGLPIARREVEIHEGSPLLNVTIDVVPLPAAVAHEAGSTVAQDSPDTFASDRAATDEGGNAWVWIVGGSVLAVGTAVVVGLLVAGGSDADPVLGNTEPAVLRGKVTDTM